ncbi:MAG: crosslink repair DNA glycosylase YcaQ family protein, partial [candidate division WOR-3 bacterium]
VEEKTFFIQRALGAMGVATVQDINRYIGISGKLNKWVAAMHEAGDIIEVEVQGLEKSYYALSKDLPALRRRRSANDKTVCLLSPFDNTIILRDRTEALFDFAYTLECYVPRKKRKYGYFSLPILWHDELVGRIDPKADRQRNVLLINSMHFEKEFKPDKIFLPALAKALNEFAAFNGCEHIELDKDVPTKIARKLSSQLI